MGYNKNLKNNRSPIVKYINEKLLELNDKNISDEEIFDICDEILKVVELCFKIQRNDKKMYNKYNKLILFEKLPIKIFRLDYMTSRDYNTSINTVVKEKSDDLKFIYLYALKYYTDLVNLYDIIYKNVISTWITKENDKKVLFSDNNEYINKLISNNSEAKLKLDNHILYVNEFINNKNIKIKSEAFYNKLIKLVENSLNNIDNILSKPSQINFYEYHLLELLNGLRTLPSISNYCKETIECIDNYFNKNEIK